MHMNTVEETRTFAQTMHVRGRVQGVGFRPFIYRLANDIGLSGSVRNQAGSVYIELLGSEEQIALFERKLSSEAPNPAIIESTKIIHRCSLSEPPGRGFRIDISHDEQGSQLNAALPIDVSICFECLRDMTDSSNRRADYPFTSCAACGPRFSITRELPFDREQTSMRVFPPCSDCEQEYRDPNNRRFHAQTISCPKCGPKVSLLDGRGQTIASHRPFLTLVEALSNGHIIAIKSTGGFHLCCDAFNKDAVSSLRALKRRPDKPFAIMSSDPTKLEPWLEIESTDLELYRDASAPIVLIPKRDYGMAELEHLAPSCRDLGVMRPYNGIYQSLFNMASSLGSKPLLIAVTSANISAEPIINNLESFINVFEGQVANILDHDLSITNPCDDSVIQGGKQPLLFRLGRGYAPLVLSGSGSVNDNSMPLLALGAHEKSTLSVSDGARIWMSPELGKLNSISACKRFDAQRQQFSRISDKGFRGIACDLHPDFHSTQVGEALSEQLNVPLIQAQHHHAHIAAVLQEHNHSGPCLGLALDGFGLGNNRQAWGGELLSVHGHRMKRLGYVTPLKLAGGDAASRHPLRCAHSALMMLGSAAALRKLRSLKTDPVWDTLFTKPNCPRTSSMGRWFDAAAAILGFSKKSSYEAEAAIYLECLAAQSHLKPSPKNVVKIAAGELNLLPLIELILIEENHQLAAWCFHAELAEGLYRWLVDARTKSGINTVVASGGCIQNRILRELISDKLKTGGFKLLLPQNLPCNDAAISLGQISIARHALAHLGDTSCA